MAALGLKNQMSLDMTQLRSALEASWDVRTSYMGVYKDENISLGQCYCTSRVVQLFFPETEIVEGQVWNGIESKKHFWNILQSKKAEYHIDFTWQQFPRGSVVTEWKIRNRETFGDSEKALLRIDILYNRVKNHLNESDNSV